MKNRREFLQLGAVALTLPLSPRGTLWPARSVAADGSAFESLYKVVFDGRFPASVAFANEAKRLGARVHGIRGDITDLWFHDLYPGWKQGPAAIAGLTAHGAIFCLERLAWDQQQMRVVFRVKHSYRPDGQIEHALAVPESMAGRAAELSNSGPDWPDRMANLVTRCPKGLFPSQAQALKKTFVEPLPLAETLEDEEESLITWVISPVVREQHIKRFER
ncbi:MAG: hypothetical protein ACRD3Q_04495 [Terriglobales bacterium]